MAILFRTGSKPDLSCLGQDVIPGFEAESGAGAWEKADGHEMEIRQERAAGRDAIRVREVTFLPIKSLQLRICPAQRLATPGHSLGLPLSRPWPRPRPVIRPLGNGTGGACREHGALKVLLLFPGLPLPPSPSPSDDASARRVHKGSSLQHHLQSASSTPSSNTWLRHDSPDPVVLSIYYFSLSLWPLCHQHFIDCPSPSEYIPQPTHQRRVSQVASRRLPPWPARRGFASWRLPWSSTSCTYFPSSTYTSSAPLSRACACSK